MLPAMTFDTCPEGGGPVYCSQGMDLSTRSHRLYRRAIWLTVALPLPVFLLAFDPTYRTWRLGAWAGCYALFVALMWLRRRGTGPSLPWLAAESLTALAATAIAGTTAEGAWLVAMVAQLAARVSLRIAVSTAILQTAVFGWLLSRTRPIEIAVDVPLAWLGFQLFAILLTHVARSEADGRSALAERNVQLLATRQLLAERTRTAERLRMARDLHDGFGHHLTALSLNLEAAAHLAEGASREHVQRAQSVARALLAEVRSTVSGVRDEGLDTMQAIRALVEPIDEPRVHVSGPPSLAVSDPSQAETLLRLVQEIVTNAIRHAQASNLWISISHEDDGLHVEGRDDGRGAGQWRDGNGLRGMRERLGALGGSLDIHSSAGSGFLVRARIPATGAGT